MKRRAVLKSVAALAAAPALSAMRVLDQAQPAAVAGLTAANLSALNALAEVALPSSLGPGGREAAVDNFARWIKNYRPGSDRGHSYGNSSLSAPTGASPAARYPAQFSALDDAAKADGAASFAALARDKRRAIVEAQLATVQGNNLPARPTGANLVADFMGLYFNSADATDLAYGAAIGRDTCRGLDGIRKGSSAGQGLRASDGQIRLRRARHRRRHHGRDGVAEAFRAQT